MNTEKDVGQFVAMLVAATKGDISKAKVELYTQHLKHRLKETNLTKLFNRLVREHTFFPSIKEIMDSVEGKKETHREKATAFVDQMTALFLSSENVYAYAGPDNYNFWKKEIGLIRHDFAHIDPKYLRSSWIDKIEAAYVRYDIEQLEALEAKKASLQIEGQA